MEVQLQELVDKIRKDGVETAEAHASEILAQAEQKAREIVMAAETEAGLMVQKGKDEADRFEKAAISAIRQAGRNLLISFRDGIGAQLESAVKKHTSIAYDQTVLKELIPVSVKAWMSRNDTDDLVLLLSPSDLEKLEAYFNEVLKIEFARGLTIKSDASLDGGFRIGTRDGASYYDFSADAVADLFSSYLNPKVADIMKAAAVEL